jgi:hypothetical protein
MWRSLARHAGIPNFLSIPKSVLYKRLKETYNLDRLQRAEARKRQGSSFRRENLTLRRQRMKESQLTDEPPSVHFSKTGWDGLPTSSSSGGASSSSSSSSSSSLSSSSSSLAHLLGKITTSSQRSAEQRYWSMPRRVSLCTRCCEPWSTHSRSYWLPKRLRSRVKRRTSNSGNRCNI